MSGESNPWHESLGTLLVILESPLLVSISTSSCILGAPPQPRCKWLMKSMASFGLEPCCLNESMWRFRLWVTRWSHGSDRLFHSSRPASSLKCQSGVANPWSINPYEFVRRHDGPCLEENVKNILLRYAVSTWPVHNSECREELQQFLLCFSWTLSFHYVLHSLILSTLFR